MPTSVAIAAAASYAGSTAAAAAVGAGWFAAGSIGASLVSGAVGFGVNSLLSSALADNSDTRQSAGQIDQEVTNRNLTVRQAVAPWQWIYGQTRVAGILTYIEDSPATGHLHMVITLAGHECQELGDVWFDDEVVPLDGSGEATGRFAGYVRVKKSLGGEAAGVQPFPDLQAESAGLWGPSHCQTGRAKLYVRLLWNPDLFPQGIPNIRCVVKGRKVYDPRSGLTAWSNNAALCTSDYLTSAVGLGCDYATEIDETQLIAAANTCEESVTLASGGSEYRYTMNGALSVNASPREVLPRLLSSMVGTVRFLGGTWGVYPAVYATPSATALTQDDLRGGLRVSPRLSKRDLANRIKGIYVSPDNDWQAADYPPVTNATYLAEDQNEPLWRELDLPFTASAATAQRLAKIELERVRQQITVTWPGKLTCYRLQPGDTVPVTLSRYGWTSKVFEVASQTLTFEESGDGVVLGCDLVLRETAAAVFDWNSGEETTVDAAPDSNLPDPFTVAVPGNPSISDELVETRDGRGVATKVTVTCAAAADVNVTFYQFEYRQNGTSTWTVFPPQASRTLEIFDIAPGRYDFRVKAVNPLGVASAYATTTNAEVVGIAARPVTPTLSGLQVAGNLAILTLQQASELDVKRGGRVLVRHTHAVTPTWEESFSIGNEAGYAGDSTIIVLPLKSDWYLVKFEDAGGRQSEAFAQISTKQASVLEYSTVDDLQEDTTFPGTKSGCVAVDGVLKLSGVGLVDDIPDFDEISSLDNYGGVEDSGTYTFSAGFDFGAVSRVRMTGELAGITVNVNDRIDDRLDNIDTWASFDGNDGGGSCDAWLEFRERDSSGDAWSAWKRLDAAEVECRYAEFRLQLRSSDTAYNIHISTLRVTAAQVV